MRSGSSAQSLPLAGAPTLATTLLRSKPTFSDYIESKKITGAHGREADTIARSLDSTMRHAGGGAGTGVWSGNRG